MGFPLLKQTTTKNTFIQKYFKKPCFANVAEIHSIFRKRQAGLFFMQLFLFKWSCRAVTAAILNAIPGQHANEADNESAILI